MIQTFVGQWFRRKSRQHTVVADTRIEGSDKLRWTISRIQWTIHKKCIKAPGAAPKVSFGPNLWVLDSQTGWQPQFRLVPKSWIHADWGWLLVRFSQRFRKVSKSHGAAPKVTQIPKLRTLVGSVIRTVSKTKNLTDTKSAGFHKSSRSISEIQWNLEKSVQVVWCCPYSTRGPTFVGQWLEECLTPTFRLIKVQTDSAWWLMKFSETFTKVHQGARFRQL